jgi:outer membrane biosynthesis protein TonB
MEAKGIETDRGDGWRDINRTNERINALLAAKKGEKQEVEKLEKQITEEEESEDYLHQRHPIEENQTKNEANPLTKFTNFLSKFSHNRDDFENFDQIIIHFPEPLEYQFPIHTANPLATSITNLSPNGNNIETKQALKLANKYQPILNDIEDQLNHIGNIDNKEIKMQSSVDNEQWRIGNNQDHTEFWIVRENKTETEVKIHLQSEKDKISLEYNLEGGDFHQLHSKLIEKLKSIPTVIFDNKPRSQPEPEIAPEPKSQPEPEIIPEPKSQPEPEIAPEPKSQPEPEIIPEPRSKPKPEITPERDREITTKYLLKPAVAAAKKETATFSEFKQQLERQLITVEEEKKENNEIKLYYTWHGDRKFTIDGNEIGGTLPDLMEKGIHYAPKSQLDQSNLIEEERPVEEQQQQQNENERIEKNKLGEEEQQQNENERIEKDKLREEQQQRKRIEEENRRIQEEEQRKQQQQKSTKRKQKRQQQKPNQDWEL